jgi:hypothetical protein
MYTALQDIVVSSSYNPRTPATELFRFYSPGVGSPVLIKNMGAPFDNYVNATGSDGGLLFGSSPQGNQSENLVLRFYIRQLPGRARNPRTDVENLDSSDIARVAIEADMNSCLSDGCKSTKGNGKRYFVAVQDQNYRVRLLGTTATDDNLPDNFVFYVAENFRNVNDEVKDGNCSIL